MSEQKFIRDAHSNAVLNTNKDALEQYKFARKQKELEQANINNMKEDIHELKLLVHQLIGKLNG